MPEKEFFALTLSAAAGFATVIGAVFAVLKRNFSKKSVAFALGFSAGMMTAVSLTDLLPQAINTIAFEMPGAAGTVACCCAYTAGVLVSRLLDIMLPSAQGAQGEGALMRLGIFSAVALMIHNLPEGMAVFLSTGQNRKLGVRLCAAIALHNIPEGIAIALPIFRASKSRLAALLPAALSAAAEPLGALLAWRFLLPYLNGSTVALMFCGIAGLMTAISFFELLPEAMNISDKNISAAGAVCAAAVVLLNCCLA